MSEAAAVMAPAMLLRTAAEETGYVAMLARRGDEASLDRLANLEELLVAAAEYEHSEPAPTLAGFLERAALTAEIDEAKRVAVTTIASPLRRIQKGI